MLTYTDPSLDPENKMEPEMARAFTHLLCPDNVCTHLKVLKLHTLIYL